MKSKLLSLFISFLVLIIPSKLFSQATCTAPTNLSATVIGTSGATFTWTAVTGTVGYIVQYRPLTNPESAWINLTTQSTSTGVTNLVCGTVYQWHVATYCGTTANPPGPYSDIHDFTTPPCTAPCVAPVGLATTNITATGVTFSWTAAAGAAAYIVQYRPITTPESPWINLTASSASITVTNLLCGTHYQWHVASHCANAGATATSPYSDIHDFTTTACTTTCEHPSGLTTTNVTTTGATFSWTAVTGAIGYTVQYRPVTNPESAWINIATQSTSITSTNLVCGTHYQWHVATYCGSTANPPSPYSAIIDFTTAACTTTCGHPEAPITTNVTATGAKFSWTAPAGALGFIVQYRPITSPESAWITVNTQLTSISITNLTCGSIYQWHVATICSTTAGGISLYTTPLTFTTLPCTAPCVAPTGLTATNITATSATFSWAASAGAVGYVFQYRPITSPESAWITLNASSTSITVTNLLCGTHYQWHVASHCANAGATATSPYSDIHDFTTTACATTCEHPSGFTTTNISATTATLSWTAVAGAAGYIVQYHIITTPASAWINVTTQTNSVTLSNLTCGTTYEWHVATVCGNSATNISPYSEIVHFTTTACTPACVAPSGLTTTNITNTGTVFSWIAAAGAVGYVFQYRPVTNPESAWIVLNASSTSITVTNLVCGTHYQWHVASHCGNTGATATSPYSDIHDFTTPACTTTCAPPTVLETGNISTTSATFSWVSPATALGYLVQYRPVTSPESAWINLTTQSNSITVTNLLCGTHYQWHVASYCGSTPTNISPYSQIINFTTLPCSNSICPAPGGLTSVALNATSGSRLLTWNSTGALSYNIRYRVQGTDAWTTTTSSTNTKLITGLQSLSHYQWQVQSVCSTASGTTFTSEWSLNTFFDTPQARTIFPNPTSGITIQLPVVIENEARMSITISDHLGRKVRSIDKTIPAGGEVLTIDIANLEGGTYFVKIKGGGKNEVQRLVINR